MALKEINTNQGVRFDSTRVKLKNPGETIEGHLVEKVTLEKDGDTFNKYTFKTSNGYVSTLGSHQIDTALEVVPQGSLVRITFQGKKKLKGGRSVNEYKIEADEENSISVA